MCIRLKGQHVHLPILYIQYLHLGPMWILTCRKTLTELGCLTEAVAMMLARVRFPGIAHASFTRVFPQICIYKTSHPWSHKGMAVRLSPTCSGDLSKDVLMLSVYSCRFWISARTYWCYLCIIVGFVIYVWCEWGVHGDLSKDALMLSVYRWTDSVTGERHKKKTLCFGTCGPRLYSFSPPLPPPLPPAVWARSRGFVHICHPYNCHIPDCHP